MFRGRRRDTFGIITLIVIAGLGLLIFKLIGSGALDGLRSNFINDWQDISTEAKIVKDNTKDLFSPPRRRPLSLLTAQETLEQSLPQLFDEFTDSDWEDFWRLIYDVHETDDYGMYYEPKRKRQLSIEEIEKILINGRPSIFGGFNGQMWQDFWKIVFMEKKKR